MKFFMWFEMFFLAIGAAFGVPVMANEINGPEDFIRVPEAVEEINIQPKIVNISAKFNASKQVEITFILDSEPASVYVKHGDFDNQPKQIEYFVEKNTCQDHQPAGLNIINLKGNKFRITIFPAALGVGETKLHYGFRSSSGFVDEETVTVSKDDNWWWFEGMPLMSDCIPNPQT